MEKRPSFKLTDEASADAIYDYSFGYEPRPWMNNLIHRLSDIAMNPDWVFAPGAEEQIADSLEQGHQLAVLVKHVNILDQFYLAAMTEELEVFEDLRGNTLIPSKAPLFWIHPIHDMRAIPVFRTKDLVKQAKKLHLPVGIEEIEIGTDDSGEPITQRKYILPPSLRAGQHRAHERLTTGCSEALDSGLHLAMMPEGTRTAKLDGTNPAEVLPIRDGILDIILGTEEDTIVDVVTLGLYAGAVKKHTGQRSAAVFINNPETEQLRDRERLRNVIQDSMQTAQNGAVWRYNERMNTVG